MFLNRRGRFFLFLVALASCARVACAGEWRVTTGYRRDFLTWNIGTDNINVLSELTWHQLSIWQAQLQLKHPVSKRVEILGKFGVGAIFNGRDLDSDYDYNDRRGEWHRSAGRADGYVIDAALAVGPRYHRQLSTLCLILNVGAAWHRQFVRSSDCYRIFVWDGATARAYPVNEWIAEGATTATYRADWITLYSELKAEMGVKPHMWWQLAGQLHSGAFVGKGDWKLRRDIDFFHHFAPAWGLSGDLTLFYRFRQGLTGTLGIEGDYWFTTGGAERLSHCGTIYWNVVRLNQAVWRSLFVSLGLHHCF